MGFLSNLFGGGAEKEAADKNRALYNQYGIDSQGYLKTGYNTGQQDLNNALGAYQPLDALRGQYQQGTNEYLNALGLNGAAGGQQAWQAFQQYNPGTQGGIDAGLSAINRRRAAGGMLNSGNADQDAQSFGQNIQNQQYGNWLSSLSGLNSNNLSATGALASGQAGVYGSMADLAHQYASDQVGVAGNVTSGDASANTLEAQGKAAGAKNLLGLGMGLAQLGLGGAGGIGGAATKITGLGGTGSSLFNKSPWSLG